MFGLIDVFVWLSLQNWQLTSPFFQILWTFHTRIISLHICTKFEIRIALVLDLTLSTFYSTLFRSVNIILSAVNQQDYRAKLGEKFPD